MDADDEIPIRAAVDGRARRGRVPARLTLVDWLRNDLGATGVHVGCEHGICGACNVVLDGRVVRSCLILAVQADGAIIETIHGATETGRVRVLQDAFYRHAALQCGFCTPGMILQAAEFLAQNSRPTRDDIREALSGNYCRCTGYEAIVNAVEAVAALLPGDAGG